MGAPEHGLDAQDQLAHAEGLDHVVVGAQLEEDHAVDLVTASRDHDDRHGGPLAQLLAHHAPVHVRQAEVEQHEVALASGQRFGAGPGEVHVEAFAHQAVPQRFGDGGVVFYYQ